MDRILNVSPISIPFNKELTTKHHGILEIKVSRHFSMAHNTYKALVNKRAIIAFNNFYYIQVSDDIAPK